VTGGSAGTGADAGGPLSAGSRISDGICEGSIRNGGGAGVAGRLGDGGNRRAVGACAPLPQSQPLPSAFGTQTLRWSGA